jgi:4-hydroxybenzoate polyprenyltransferase
MTWQLSKLNTDDPANCLRLFRANRDCGLIIVLFLATAMLVD